MVYEHFQLPVSLNSRGRFLPTHHVGKLSGWRSLVSSTEIKRHAWHCLWMKCVHFSLAKIVLAGSEHITFWGNCHPRPSKIQSQTEIKRRAWHRLWMKCRYHSSHAVEYGARGCETGYNSNVIAMQVPCNSQWRRKVFSSGGGGTNHFCEGPWIGEASFGSRGVPFFWLARFPPAVYFD